MPVFTAILKGVRNARTFEMNQIEEVTTNIHRKVEYLKTIIENYDAEIRGIWRMICNVWVWLFMTGAFDPPGLRIDLWIVHLWVMVGSFANYLDRY